MKAFHDLKKYISRSFLAVTLLAVVRGLVRAIPVWIAGALLLSALDQWGTAAAWGRQVLWGVFALVGLRFFISGFLPRSIFSIEERSRNLARHLSSLRDDDLKLADELSIQVEQDGISSELRIGFVERVADKLSTANPFWTFPRWKWRGPLALSFCSLFLVGSLRAFFPTLLPLGSRSLFPFWSSSFDGITIQPGDAQVPRGSDATIELNLREASAFKPVLMVKTGDSWLRLEATLEGPQRFTYVIKKVVTPLFYRVEWRGEWTRKFKLTPVEPFSITKFHIRLQPPEYTGKQTLEQTTPEISGLAGSRVELEIEMSQAIPSLALVFSDNREIAADRMDGKSATFHFVLDKSGTYGFEKNLLYPIHVMADKPPTVVLLSPDQDLVVGEKEKLPVTFDARDDFGLEELTIQWENQSGKTGRFRVRTFDAAEETSLSTYNWDLSSQGFSQGQVVRFRLEVKDRNRVTGPGVGTSEWRVIEIRSFELEHAVLEKGLQAWRDKAVETLAKVSTLDKKLDAQNPDMSAVGQEFTQAAQNMNRLEEALKQIVNKMEEDPLVDYGVLLEHKEMQENLAHLNQTAVKNAQAAFQTQNKEAAQANMKNIANELERMAALSEDLSKTQNARDVMDSGENLEKIGEELTSALENGTADPAMMAKINQMLAEAQKNLAEMARALQKMPEELPEDFVNQEALKNLELGKSQDILSQIAEAIKKGDMKHAMELAKSFAAAAKAMRQQLSEAHESFLESHSVSEIEKKIKAQQQALQAIADEERSLLNQTQALATKELEEVLREQDTLLQELSKRQEKVVVEAKTIPSLSGQVPPMETVWNELKQKRVDRSMDLLAGIVSQLTFMQAEFAKSENNLTLVGRLQKLSDEEKAIRALMENPPPPKRNPSAQDVKQYQQLDERQQDIRKRTLAVRQELQVLSRKTASLGGQMMETLNNAASEMKNASDRLADKNGVTAQRHEERALDNLLDGDSQLQQALSAMSEMAGEGGAPGDQPGGNSGGKGGPKVILRGGGGSRSSQMGKVRLPNAEDYRPPKAFREDLLESLKENYPKIYEEIIHEYYKRLAQ